MSDFSSDPKARMDDPTSVGAIGAHGISGETAEDIEDIAEADEIGEYVEIGGVQAEQQEGKNPYNNPKNHIITAALLVGMMIVLMITQHIKNQYTAANFESCIDVVVQQLRSGPAYAEEKLYYSVAADGEQRQTEEFEGAGVQRFITGYYGHESGRMNYLSDRSVYRDEDADDRPDGEPVKATPVFERILELIEQTETEHWIMQARILCTGEAYFVCVNRNVNLWTPYVLYYYSAEHDVLYELTTLSDMDVIDIRLGENFEQEMDELIGQ